MARTNLARPPIHTHEGGRAKHINPTQELRRSVMACMLFEDTFYESGEDGAARIARLVGLVAERDAAAIALEARGPMNIRHAALLVAAAMAYHFRGSRIVGDTVRDVIQRADELAEIVALACRINKVGPDQVKSILSAQMKRGLAEAFPKFNEYALAKYDRKNAIRLRDVLFLCHAKPRDEEQAAVWKRLIAGELATPDTWEVGLSTGGDKRETFTRLLDEDKLGYLALLRNLRNMAEAGVDRRLVEIALLARHNGAERVLPFRYVAAARHAPQFARAIDVAFRAALAELEPLEGRTVVLVDVSGSMNVPMSARSDLSRIDAAAALAVIVPGDVRVFTFSNALAEVPAWAGLPGIDAIKGSQPYGGTWLGQAVTRINADITHDRLIVVTDEQSADKVPDPVAKRAYMVNVAPYRNGVGYGKWTSISGFSENILRFIAAVEAA